MPKTNNSRKHKAELDAREIRLKKLTEYRANKRSLTEYANDMGITYRTALRDVKELNRRRREMSDDFVSADSAVQEREIAALKLETMFLRAKLETSTTLPLKDQFAIALAIISQDVKIMEREAKLRGWDKDTNKIEITGLQLDPLTIEVRALLFDLPEAERIKVRDFAKSLVPPVTIDADCFSSAEPKQLTEGEHGQS